MSPLELQDLYLELRQRDASSKEIQQARQRFSRYQNDAVGFVRDVLGREPWSKQVEILTSVQQYTYTAVRSCHGAGKTHTAANAALWFLQSFPGSVVITTAPSGRQVRDLLWRQVRSGFEGSRQLLLGRCMTTQLDIAPDWYATGFATDEPLNFQGPHSAAGLLFIGDEASGLPEWVFDTARGFMTQNNARMLLIGNPNHPVGSFYEAFSSSRWNCIHISAFEVPEKILRPAWKEEMKEDFGEDSSIYEIRVLGQFPRQSENSLFDFNWIEAAQACQLPSDDPTEIGVDIGRFGADESVAFVRQGPRVVDLKVWQGKDTMQSAGRVIELCKRWWPRRVKVDEIGIGSGVVDKLREEGWPVAGFNSNSAPKNAKEYSNLRSEQYAELASRFRKGEIDIPVVKNLMKQMLSLTYEHTGKGLRKVIGKEELRKRGKASPNLADALMICFAEDLGRYIARSATSLRGRVEAAFAPRADARVQGRRSPGSSSPLGDSFSRPRFGGRRVV